MIYASMSNTSMLKAGWPIFFACGYLAAVIIGLANYIQPFSISFLLGGIAMASTFSKKHKTNRSLFFVTAAIVFLILNYFIPAKTLLFIAIILAIFAVLQLFSVYSNYRTLLALLIMSPIAKYIFSLFGFPIRLFLTRVAGYVLKIIHPATETEGNLILTKTSAFSVDPACMGLHMLVSSMLAGIILIDLLEKKENKYLSKAGFFICLSTIFCLNVVSNLLRILCLVYFNIGPGRTMHEVIGIVCFLVYIILPAILLVKFYLKKFAKHRPEIASSPANLSRASIVLQTILLLIILAFSINGRERTVNDIISIKNPVVPGYRITELEDRVIKMENSRSLTYIKPIAGFYSTDHQPMICWSGSGYDFKDIKENCIGGRLVYQAVLENKHDKLYTAWWYDNGHSSTLSQFEWRWNSFRKGDRYCLINLSATTPQLLEEEINRLSNSFDPASIFLP